MPRESPEFKIAAPPNPSVRIAKNAIARFGDDAWICSVSVGSDAMPPFAEIYDEHVWRVYGFIAYRVDSREDAEDLTSQAFERALRAWHRYDERRAAPATWPIAIARNLLIDRFRSTPAPGGQSALHETPDSALPSRPGPEHDLGVTPELAAALARLSEREREVIALRFGGDLTGQQIADLTGMSLANAQQVLSRTLRRLRADLEGQRAGVAQDADGSDGEQQRADAELPSHQQT